MALSFNDNGDDLVSFIETFYIPVSKVSPNGHYVVNKFLFCFDSVLHSRKSDFNHPSHIFYLI